MSTGIVAFVPDLMDRSRLPDGVRFVSSPAALVDADEDVVLVDLSRPPVLAVLVDLARPGRRVVGFTGHADSDVLATARAAGCEAMPRSRFFSDPARWLEPGE